MNVYSIGDQARNFTMKSAAGKLKDLSNTLTQELASGEVSDIGHRVSGNTQALRAIEVKIKYAEQFHKGHMEMANSLQAMSDVLSHVQSSSAAIAISIISESLSGDASMVSQRAAQAAKEIDLTIARLNTSSGGQYLFSGMAFDTSPLLSGHEMLDLLENVVSGLTSAEDISQAISGWFDAPSGSGGFLDTIYQGSDEEVRKFRLSQDATLTVGVTAGSAAVREVLKGLSMIAILDRGVASGAVQEHSKIMQTGGSIVYDSVQKLIEEQARLGMVSQLLERSNVENSTLLTSLQLSRNEIRSVDIVETSLAAKNIETQLEAVYTVIGRLSRLNLVDYLR